MNIYYTSPHVQQLPPGHRFPMGKYERLRQRLGQELPQLRLSLADPVSDGELALVHTPAYIWPGAPTMLTPTRAAVFVSSMTPPCVPG